MKRRRAAVALAASLLIATATTTNGVDFSEGHERIRTGEFEAARTAYATGLTNAAAEMRSIAQLAIAQSYAIEGKLSEAKREYAKLREDAPAHHKWEAAERIKELDRVARGLPARDPAASRTQTPPAPRPNIVFHVSPNGSDTNDGSSEKPFATLQRARDAIRAARERSRSNSAFQVLIHAGEYAVNQTFELDARDSGTEKAPVVYRVADGGRASFRGGLKLSGFEALRDGPNWTSLPAGSRGKVMQADLKHQGITNLLPLTLGGFSSGHGFKTHPGHELFFNGKPMQLARGPNEGFLRIKDVVVKDGTKGYDRSGSKVGQFICENDALTRWQNEPELLLYGYWFWDWADSYEKVRNIDAPNRTITLAEPFHKYGYSIGAPFYAINAVCELDQPGEWYLDRQNMVVLLYPPSEIQNATIELSTFPKAMVELQNVSHVRFEGLTWELGSADAIHVKGGRDVLFAGCTVRQFAGNGIEIIGGQHHGILSSDIYSMGRGGTIVQGGNRKDLTPGRHFVENCDIHNLSRIDHTYTPAVVLDGVGNRIAHNRFHEIASSAMRVNGNDHLVEYNEVFHVVTESDDQGGADMYGNATFRGNVFRFNHWHHIGNWEGKGEQPKCGQAGIRLDDAICGTLVYGNIFERCSAGKIGFGGVQIHGGKDNVIDNNMFISCAAALSFTPWNAERFIEFTKEGLDSRRVDRALYLQRYPQLGEFTSDANKNYIWRNRGFAVGEFLRRAPKNLHTADNSSIDRCDPVATIPGFSRIPVEEIGLYSDSFRKLPEPQR